MKTPRFASEVLSPFPIDYDARSMRRADLELLNAAQCRALLTQVIEPNLKDLANWLVELEGKRDRLQRDENSFAHAHRRLTAHEQDKLRALKESVRQLSDGLKSADPVAPSYYELLAPLLKRPGLARTAGLIAKLGPTAITSWPTWTGGARRNRTVTCAPSPTTATARRSTRATWSSSRNRRPELW